MSCFFLLIYWKYIWEIFNGVFIEGVLTRLGSPQSLGVEQPRHPLSHTHKHNHRVGWSVRWRHFLPDLWLVRGRPPLQPRGSSHLISLRDGEPHWLYSKKKIKSWLFSSRAARLLAIHFFLFLFFLWKDVSGALQMESRSRSWCSSFAWVQLSSCQRGSHSTQI